MLDGNAEAVRVRRELALGAGRAELERARRFFDAAAADFGLDEGGRHQVTTAAHEAVSNALRHGAPLPGGVIYLAASADDGELVCLIHDGGNFKPLAKADPDPWAEHGRGFPMMQHLMDEVALETGSQGTIVRLSRRRRASSS